jgi:hypothetical protein
VHISSHDHSILMRGTRKVEKKGQIGSWITLRGFRARYCALPQIGDSHQG